MKIVDDYLIIVNGLFNAIEVRELTDIGNLSHLGGRLGAYRYYGMDAVIASA